MIDPAGLPISSPNLHRLPGFAPAACLFFETRTRPKMEAPLFRDLAAIAG
jgi:hypothetical protein